MIFHPPILALVVASVLSAAMMLSSGFFALRVLRQWDLTSGSEAQVVLERRTYFVSTILAFVMLVEACSLLLFVFNADRMAPMFVGAMCAVGVLNASIYGFPALYAKITVFFASVVWLAVDAADQKGRDYPLIRIKFALLLGLVPISVVEAALNLAFFLDLKADSLTSCCGSLFSPNQSGLGADLAGLGPATALWMLASGFVVTLITGALAARGRLAAIAHGVGSIGFFVVAMIAVVSVISLYVYEHPHHHCPFCLLKREYAYFGFALYAPLFVGTATGLASGVLGALTIPISLRQTLPSLRRRLVRASVLGFMTFVVLSALVVWSSKLKLIA